MCLENVSEDFSVNKIKKIRLNGCLYNVSVDYRIFDINNITNIDKFFFKGRYKIMFEFNKKMFVTLLTSIVIKQSKMYDSTYSYCFINLHPNKYSQELRY